MNVFTVISKQARESVLGELTMFIPKYDDAISYLTIYETLKGLDIKYYDLTESYRESRIIQALILRLCTNNYYNFSEEEYLSLQEKFSLFYDAVSELDLI